jgi:hypothetical protein
MKTPKRADIRLTSCGDDNFVNFLTDFIKAESQSNASGKTKMPYGNRTLLLLGPYVLLRKMELDAEANSDFAQTKDLITKMDIDTKVLVRSFVERQKRHLNDLETLLNEDILRSIVADKLGSLGVNDKNVTISDPQSLSAEKSGYIAAMDITNSIVKASANEKPLPKTELKIEAQHDQAKVEDALKQPQEAEYAKRTFDSIDDDDGSEDSGAVVPDLFG